MSDPVIDAADRYMAMQEAAADEQMDREDICDTVEEAMELNAEAVDEGGDEECEAGCDGRADQGYEYDLALRVAEKHANLEKARLRIEYTDGRVTRHSIMNGVSTDGQTLSFTEWDENDRIRAILVPLRGIRQVVADEDLTATEHIAKQLRERDEQERAQREQMGGGDGDPQGFMRLLAERARRQR